MSATELDKLNLALLKEVQEVLLSNKREELNTVLGQIFIFNFKGYEDYLSAKLQTKEFGYTEVNAKKEAEKSKKLFMGYLEAAQRTAKIPKQRLNSLKRWKRSLENGKVPGAAYKDITPSTHKVYIVEDYSSVKKAKANTGTDFETSTGVRKGVITGEIRKGSTRKDFEGYQLGHGEFGVAVSGTKVLAAERLLTKLNNKGLTDIKEVVENSKGQLETTSLLKASQVIDSDGNFKKSFVPFISNQTTEANQKDATIEKQAVDSIKAAVKKKIKEIDVLNQKGSDSIKEAVTATIKYNFAKKNNLDTSGPTKPKKVSKSRTRSKKKDKSSYKVKVPIAAGAGAIESKSRGRRSGAQSRGGAELLGLFNRDLNKVLQQNMTSPRLNYRTGRFADSVKVVDVNTTAKGFPSFGYTYDKFPYQTFEPGYAQGSQQRDPRKLIDASMREIATQYALGRFFTRRL